ncbi:uncharacterized protein LOC128956902 [Oppia nitens]|uniref:uncharacterized protein LOC128956902 n=1 Tax=Oppia nitens TaxID=1686743 RepID=UPI0023DC2C7D|nr:uncharacterized protein LOC128956902 [Oppia nitens]
MDYITNNNKRDRNFRYRKWAVQSASGFTMVAGIILVTLTVQYVNSSYKLNPHSYNNLEKVRNLALGVGISAILIQLIGQLGAYREHYFTCLVYGITLIILFPLSILSCFWTDFGIDWLLSVLYLVCTVNALIFARILRRLRNHQLSIPVQFGQRLDTTTTTTNSAAVVMAETVLSQPYLAPGGVGHQQQQYPIGYTNQTVYAAPVPASSPLPLQTNSGQLYQYEKTVVFPEPGHQYQQQLQGMGAADEVVVAEEPPSYAESQVMASSSSGSTSGSIPVSLDTRDHYRHQSGRH